MILLDVQTGKPLQNVAYDGDFQRTEFIEQFNEYLLIKQEGKPLRLYNVVTKKHISVPGFETPEAFFFLYEKEIIACVAAGKIRFYKVSDGRMITDFQNEVIYTKFKLGAEHDS